jgi:hypothetical protein
MGFNAPVRAAARPIDSSRSLALEPTVSGLTSTPGAGNVRADFRLEPRIRRADRAAGRRKARRPSRRGRLHHGAAGERSRPAGMAGRDRGDPGGRSRLADEFQPRRLSFIRFLPETRVAPAVLSAALSTRMSEARALPWLRSLSTASPPDPPGQAPRRTQRRGHAGVDVAP